MIDSQWGDRFGGTMGIAPVSCATLLMGLVLFAEIRILRGDKATLVTWGRPSAPLLFLLLSLTRSAWIGCGLGSIVLLGWLCAAAGLDAAGRAPRGRRVSRSDHRLWSGTPPLDANHSRAAEERFLLNYINLEMIKAHPLIGIGLNTAYDSKTKYLPELLRRRRLDLHRSQSVPPDRRRGWHHRPARLPAYSLDRHQIRGGRRTSAECVDRGDRRGLPAYWSPSVWGMNLDFYGGMQVYGLLWFIFGCAAGVHVLAQREAAAGGGRAGGGLRTGGGEMSRPLIDLIVGARPNFVKVAPVHRALRALGTMDLRLVHTGQHYDANMSDVFFQELGIPTPDVFLGVGSGNHGAQTGAIIAATRRSSSRRGPR